MRVEFDTRTGELYSINMRYLRQQIRRLHERRDTAVPQLLVRVPAPDLDQVYVDCFIRTSDLYLTGVGNRSAEFYFNDNAAIRTMGKQQLLGFSGHYSNLGSYEDLRIDRQAINAAISQISHWQRGAAITNRHKDSYGTHRPSPDAAHLLMLILLISEAARFFDIERTIANALDWRPNLPLTPLRVQELTHRWDELSRANDFWQVAITSPGARAT